MSKTVKTEEPKTQDSEAFEMIELAVGDLETLTRAFDLISEVCEEQRRPAPALPSVPKTLVN